MNIGFDLDKILIDTPPFIPGRVINMLYKKKDNGELLYRIPSRPMQLFRRATHVPLLRPPIKENLAFLQSIANKKNKLYLISSRFKFLEGVTNQIIKTYKLDSTFDGLYFNYENKQPHVFKNDVLKKLKLDIYIDDDLSLIKYVARDNPKTTFYWFDTIKGKHKIGQNIIAISNLDEIFQEKGVKH